VGYLTPLLYEGGPGGAPLGGAVCTDVVSGGNTTAQAGGYDAGVGYDAVSGWGTPDGVKLQEALAKITTPAVAAEPAKAETA
jgi:kumamolisin